MTEDAQRSGGTVTKSSRLAIALLTLIASLGIGTDVVLPQAPKPQPLPAPQAPKPEPLPAPVVEKWRAPLLRLLGEVGVQDAERVAASTKASSLGGDPEVMVLRLEHGSTCLNAICLTIVGSIENGELASHAMLFAPKNVTRGDASLPFLGADRRTLITLSEKGDPRDGPAISVLRTRNGWIIVPH